ARQLRPARHRARGEDPFPRVSLPRVRDRHAGRSGRGPPVLHPMRVTLLTAVSVNGMITGEKGRNAHELEGFLGTPREVMEHKAARRRRFGAVLVGTETVRVD